MLQTPMSSLNSIDHTGTIDQGQRVIVRVSLCSGLCSQDKPIPLKHAPHVIELELVGNAADCLNTGDNGKVSPVVNSTSWVIEQPPIKCDIVTLDSELQHSYTAQLLSGKSLPVHFSIYATTVQQAQGKSNSIPFARSFTRLKSVFISMFREDANTRTSNSIAPSFYHPLDATYNKSTDYECQLQRGSKLFPEYPMQSLAETFYSLRKTLGITNIGAGSVKVSNRFSMNNKFVLATDCENMFGASFTGYTAKSGELMTIRLLNAWDCSTANTAPSQINTALHYDAVLSISDSGSQVME